MTSKLLEKLNNRKINNTFRSLTNDETIIDFFSNDYLGFAKSETIYNKAHNILKNETLKNGSTGSRLISGNNTLIEQTESLIAKFHNCDSALLFNSGYDANLGLLSSIPQLGDVILYDELSHASIRDGIRLSSAKSYKFNHNSLTDLETKLTKFEGTKYVVVESVYSMDGDSPDLITLSKLCKKHQAFLIVDEAHGFGVFGNQGKGLCQELEIENQVFARIVTYGKALGCHGASVLGSNELKQFLINFSRPFIYTTAPSPHAISTIQASYNELAETNTISNLRTNINYFKLNIKKHGLANMFIKSNSAIQCLIIGDTAKTKTLSNFLNSKGFNCKAILAPTITKGKERIRFCLHSYNTKQEIDLLFGVIEAF